MVTSSRHQGPAIGMKSTGRMPTPELLSFYHFSPAQSKGDRNHFNSIACPCPNNGPHDGTLKTIFLASSSMMFSKRRHGGHHLQDYFPKLALLPCVAAPRNVVVTTPSVPLGKEHKATRPRPAARKEKASRLPPAPSLWCMYLWCPFLIV